jgi:signal transduction histidine kinase/CheY-like chemotaxis protein
MPSTAVLADFYLIVLLIGTIVTTFLIVFSWQRRVVPGASYSGVMNFFVFLWLVFTILDWTSPNQEIKYFWNQVGYICVGFLPMAWLAFSLKFTQKTWFSPIYLLILAIVPTFVLLLAFRGDLWINRQYSYIDGSFLNGRYIYQEVVFSGWIYVSIGYAYILNVAGTFNILYSVYRDPDKYQPKAIAIIITGAVAPLTLNVLYNFHIIPNWTMDLTPLGFTISSVALTYALFRHRLLNLIPFARDMLVDTMSDGLIVMDLNDKILDLNPAAQAITIQPQIKSIGQSIFSVLPAIKSYPFNGEIDVMVNQATRFYEIQSSPLFNKNSGRVEGHMLMLRDITARKDAEVKLFRSEEIFRSLIEQSHDGVMLTDHEGRISIWNQSMDRITGFHQEEILGHFIWDLVNVMIESRIDLGITTQMVKDEFIAMMSNRSSFVFDPPLELPIRLPGSGEERYIQNVTFPINTSSGIILGSITRDVTQAKRNENKIKQLYEESKSLQKQAEAASESKSQFLAVMSHELRTPLNAVIGMIQLLLDTDLSRKQQVYAKTIRSSGDTLFSLINDILDYSKIESGKMELEAQPVNIRSIIEESFDLVSQHAAEKGLELVYIIGSFVPDRVIADPTRLRQVITNLMGNAVKFTDKGEVTLTVHASTQPTGTLEPRPKNKQYEIQFAVKDTGIGIPEDKLGRLFQTFSQIDQSTTRVYGGTGLGLAICKRLTEAMHGSLKVQSEVGKGSIFTFTIQVEALPTPPDDTETRFTAAARGKSLLVFDNNPSFLRMVSKRMRHLGMIVEGVSTHSALEAVLLNLSTPFDIILFDCTPLSAARSACLAHIQPLIGSSKLVLLTDQLNPILDRQILNAAAVVMHKPLKYYLLLNTLTQVLNGESIRLHLNETHENDRLPVIGPQHPLRILMVEDNLINQKVSLSAMERLGYRVQIANNGFECLEMMREHIYDLIFMDVQMAEMDGLETTRRIRKQWPVEHQPFIVALTAAAMMGDRAICIEAGMNNYISKPIRLHELAQTLINTNPISQFDPEPYIFLPEENEDISPIPDSSIDIALIDRSAIRELMTTLGENKADLALETIDIFMSESGNFISILKKAAEETNLEKMHRLTHTLKSTTASVGAVNLSALCKTLDIEIRTLLSSPEPCFSAGRFDQDIEQISTGFALVCLELEKVKIELSGL